MLLAAVVAVLIATGVVAGNRIFYAETREPRLEAALAELAAAQDCLSPADAESRISALLASLGYQGWDVERTAGVRDDSCVSTAVAIGRACGLAPPRLQPHSRRDGRDPSD